MLFSTSNLSLRLKASVMRIINAIFSFLDRRLSSSGRYLAAQPKLQLAIPSTVSTVPGKIQLLFYAPKSFTGTARRTANGSRGLPVIINFHGGGFTIGAPNNDARWASAAIEERDTSNGGTKEGAVMISVGYRLAPEYPHPVGIEDGVDAILWVCAHADEYGLDRSRIVLSGFSAGGNLSLTVAFRFHVEMERRKAADHGGLMGIISFYPGIDYTKSRAERRASNKAPGKPAKPAIPDFLLRLFDDSYLQPRKEMDLSSIYLSPAVASPEILRKALPEQIALFTCEWDQVFTEAEDFRTKLKEVGKQVGGSVIIGVDHAWDKKPTFGRENAKRDAMYAEAAQQLEKMLR